MFKQQRIDDMIQFCEGELAETQQENFKGLSFVQGQLETTFKGEALSESKYPFSHLLVDNLKVNYRHYINETKSLLLDVDPPFVLSPELQVLLQNQKDRRLNLPEITQPSSTTREGKTIIASQRRKRING